jgi:hypothetical protein
VILAQTLDLGAQLCLSLCPFWDARINAHQVLL